MISIYHSHKNHSSWSHSPSRWLHLGILTKTKTRSTNNQFACLETNNCPQAPPPNHWTHSLFWPRPSWFSPYILPLHLQHSATSPLRFLPTRATLEMTKKTKAQLPKITYSLEPTVEMTKHSQAVFQTLSVSWHFVVPVHGSWLAMIIPNILKGRFITPYKFTNQQGFWTLLNCRKSWNVREPAEFPLLQEVWMSFFLRSPNFRMYTQHYPTKWQFQQP